MGVMQLPSATVSVLSLCILDMAVGIHLRNISCDVSNVDVPKNKEFNKKREMPNGSKNKS